MLYTSSMEPLEVDEEERARLRELGRAPTVGWWVRDRVEMVLLAAEGWSAPRIAQHLGVSAQTVRRVVRAFRQHGTDALERKLPGPPPDLQNQFRVRHALAALLEQPRTWTASQLSGALEVHGLHLGPRQVRRYLNAMGASWQRTKMSLTHKQRAEEVARARRRLVTLKKRLVRRG
jgi:putative transposase